MLLILSLTAKFQYVTKSERFRLLQSQGTKYVWWQKFNHLEIILSNLLGTICGAYIDVEMPIPEDKSENDYAKRIRQHGKINGKLIAMIGGSCYKNHFCRNLLRGYTGHQCVGILMEQNTLICLINYLQLKSNQAYLLV